MRYRKCGPKTVIAVRIDILKSRYDLLCVIGSAMHDGMVFGALLHCGWSRALSQCIMGHGSLATAALVGSC